MQKKLFFGLINRTLWCILYALFAVYCTLAAEETKPSGIAVRLADPATESVLTENRERLAKQTAEIEKLKTENIQKETENARKTAEISKLKAEISKKESEIQQLHSTVQSKDSALKSRDNSLKEKEQVLAARDETIRTQDAKLKKLDAEKKSLKDDKSRLEAEKKTLEAEILALNTEKNKLKAQISKEKTELSAEKSLIEEENQNLRKELLETLERCTRLTERLKRMEQSAAGVLETLEPVYTGVRESELADALSLSLRSGMSLIGKSTAVCDLVLNNLDKMKLSDVEKARFRVAVEELTAQNQAFARLSIPAAVPEGVRECRILEVRNQPEIAVLNAGYRNGIRVNMTFEVSSKPECVLKIIAVRPFVAAAVVEKGSIQDLSAGMEVRVPEPEKTKNKTN